MQYKNILIPVVIFSVGCGLGHFFTSVKNGLDYKDKEVKRSFDTTRTNLIERGLINRLDESEWKTQLLTVNNSNIAKSVWPVALFKPDFENVIKYGGHDSACQLVLDKTTITEALEDIIGVTEFVSAFEAYSIFLEEEIVNSGNEMNNFHLSCKKLLQSQ